jgi:hypothetical protein
MELPNEIIRLIFFYLAKTYEPNGIRNISMVTQDIIKLAFVCQDFYSMLQDGMKYIIEQIENEREEKMENCHTIRKHIDWDKIISAPNSCTISYLQEATRYLDLTMCKKKSKLIRNLFSKFNILVPTKTPSRIIFRCKTEKLCYIYPFSRKIRKILKQMKKFKYFTDELPYNISRRFGTYENLLYEYELLKKNLK